MVGRRASAALFVVLGLAIGGCGDADSSGDADGPGGSGGDPGEGVSCNGQVIAPPLDDDEIVGEWGYVNSTLYEDGEDYYATARGDLVIQEDGRWEGERVIVSGDGSFTYPTAYGPGDWDFDSRSLTLEYDDGSDAETYTGVRVSDQLTAEGAPVTALTLEVADETGCTVLLLEKLR